MANTNKLCNCFECQEYNEEYIEYLNEPYPPADDYPSTDAWNKCDLVDEEPYNSFESFSPIFPYKVLEMKEEINMNQAKEKSYNPVDDKMLEIGDYGGHSLKPRTQKAMGILGLKKYCYRFMGCLGVPCDTHLFPNVDLPTLRCMKFPLFVRPCPTRPRHGFVESRQVKSFEEILALYSEAMIQDEAHTAELILMPVLTGKNSGIALYNNVSWGRGNDGVTSGKGMSYSIPTIGDKESWNFITKRKAGLHCNYNFIQDTAYLEMVEDKGITRFVQLRDGPTPPAAGIKDVISHDILVKEVINTRDYPDLLEWEKKIKSVEKGDGVVVTAYGHALSSHYAVHAIQHNIPVVTDSNTHVIIGKVLKKATSELPSLNEGDIEEIHRYAIRELKRSSLKLHPEDGADYIGAVGCEGAYTAVGTIHSQSVWGKEKHLLKLRGVSVVRLMRYALSACMGELRHMKTTPITPIPNNEYAPYSRSSIYDYCLQYGSLEEALKFFPTIIQDYEADENWEKCKGCQDGCDECYDYSNNEQAWRPGYGGKAWARVSKAAYEMIKMLNEFIHNPNLLSYRDLMCAANMFIHQSHNSGKVMTKWLAESDMTYIAESTAFGFLNQDAATTVLSVYSKEV